MSRLFVTDSGGVRTITFDRPEARNALTFAMRAIGAAGRAAAERGRNA